MQVTFGNTYQLDLKLLGGELKTEESCMQFLIENIYPQACGKCIQAFFIACKYTCRMRVTFGNTNIN
jgi:hypothetical protein